MRDRSDTTAADIDSGSDMTSPASLWFGDCETIMRLHVGGMSTIHLARRHGTTGLSRPVAIKALHPYLVKRRAVVEAFIDEAWICSQINHPHVIQVEEFGVIA